MHGRQRPDTRVLGLSLICGLALGGAALAQTPAADPGKPAQPDAPKPQPVVIVPRIVVAPAEAPALEPVRPNLPPTAGQDLALPTNPPLLREGAFVAGARAQLVRGKSGRWYAIFDPDASGRQLPPMIVLENSYLAAMERVAERETAGTRVRLSGRTTVYRDRNFLLPSAPPIMERPVAVEPDASATVASQAASAAANTPAISGKNDPSIEQIMSDLDKAVGPRKSGPVATPPAAAPNTHATGNAPATAGFAPPADSNDRDVTPGFLASRRARIIRGADGQLMAVMDSGTGGRTDGPLVLLPCTNLTYIEAYVDAGGESASFTLSGDVYVYKSRRYLLPTMFTVNRGSNLIMPTH